MAKNHWNSKSKTRQEAYKYGYKSGLEHKVAETLRRINYPVNYETETLQVHQYQHHYTNTLLILYLQKKMVGLCMLKQKVDGPQLIVKK
jgi:hypothetical protein